MASITEMGKALSPRTFEIGRELTVDELYDLLAKRASAFQMPFQKKGGIGGDRISFKKEPELDVMLSVTVKGNKVKITPAVTSNQTNIHTGNFSFDVGKNSVARKGVKGVMDRPMLQGAYIDTVTETITKIINGEPVEDYVAPVKEAPAKKAAAEKVPTKSWLVTLLLNLFLGGLGVHRFYVGKIGTGILWLLTGGVLGIGWFVDFIMILIGKFKDKNGCPLKK